MIGSPRKKHNTMPFYEALCFLLNAPKGAKITREIWDGVYLIKKYDKKNNHIVYITDGNTFEDEYTAHSGDMVAKDWYIIMEDC